jgi:nitrilase
VEGILYATCRQSEQVIQNQAHDIVGTYNRAEIFHLSVDTSRPSLYSAAPATPAND